VIGPGDIVTDAPPGRVLSCAATRHGAAAWQGERGMTSNVGGIDRGLRIAAGVALLLAGAFGPLGWWGLVGLVPLATGLIGFCPAYPLLGISTCAVKKQSV
jgi:hypothetical protein